MGDFGDTNLGWLVKRVRGRRDIYTWSFGAAAYVSGLLVTSGQGVMVNHRFTSPSHYHAATTSLVRFLTKCKGS